MKHSQWMNIFSLRTQVRRDLAYRLEPTVQHKVRAPAPLTTGFVAIPPISRTREWLFSTAPATPVAASESETREDTRTMDAIGCELVQTGGSKSSHCDTTQVASAAAQVRISMLMIILSAHDPPGGVSTLEPGALPAAVRMAVLA